MKVAISLLIAVCISTNTVSALGDNVFYYSSSPRAFLFEGKTKLLTPASSQLSMTGQRTFDLGNRTNTIEIIVSSILDNWTMEFVGPNNSLPIVGSYQNAEVWPAQSAGKPGFTVFGNGRGDSTLTGSFQVLEATFFQPGYLQSYAVDFTLYENGNPELWDYGSVRFNSNVPINPVPEPAAITLAVIGFIGALRPLNRLSDQATETQCVSASPSATCSGWQDGRMVGMKFRPRFSLRTFFVAITLISVLLWWLETQRRFVLRRQQFVSSIRTDRGGFSIRWESIRYHPNSAIIIAPSVDVMRRMLGDEPYFLIVLPSNTSQADIDEANYLFPESGLEINHGLQKWDAIRPVPANRK